ncbi:MAG TPA: thermonuclease family protein [Chloroflexota bacterium]|nr:thermonuclease family protein [Chloroflexota bacterium]
MKRLLLSLSLVVLVAVVFGVAVNAQSDAQPKSGRTGSEKVPAPVVKASVTRIVDGESIEVDIPGRGGVKVRYLGISTPESSDPRRSDEYLVEVATTRNRGLVDGKTVYLEKDATDADKEGRLLRYVYLADGTFVNQQLAKDGFAVAKVVPPDVKHRAALEAAEKDARNHSRGMWGPVEAFGPMEILPVVNPTPVP